MIRQAAAIDPNLAVLLVVHNSLGIPPIRDFADEETKQRVLPVLATGRGLTTVATSEPGMGSNVVRGMTATAVRQADRGYIINGEKSWISLGAASTYITVLARLQEPNGRKRGITAFLLPTSTPGFRPRSEAMTIGLRAIPQDHIALENMRVPASAVPWPGGRRRRGGPELLPHRARLPRRMRNRSDAAMRPTGRAIRRQRSIATGRLLDNGVAQQILADCAAATRTVEALVFSLADRLDGGGPVPEEFFLACKIIGCELAGEVVDQCVQLMGARGFVDTDIVGKYFRDFRVLRIFEGATEAMSVFSGTRVLRDLESFDTTMVKSFGITGVAATVKAGLHDLVERRDRPHPGPVPCAGPRRGRRGGLGRHGGGDGRSGGRQPYGTRHLRGVLGCPKAGAASGSARNEIRPALTMSAHGLARHIAGYAGSIGDTQQSHGGERRTLDAFLQRVRDNSATTPDGEKPPNHKGDSPWSPISLFWTHCAASSKAPSMNYRSPTSPRTVIWPESSESTPSRCSRSRTRPRNDGI